MCDGSHTANNPLKVGSRPPLELVDGDFDRLAELGSGVSAALLRRVSRSELPTTMRIHRTGRNLAFGRVDRLAPGYGEALATARAHRYEPVSYTHLTLPTTPYV